MKLSIFIAVALAFVATSDAALAQTRAERCSAYARQAARSSPTTTGPLRGAARGAAGGAIGGAIAGTTLAEVQELERQLVQALARCEVRLSGTAHINGILTNA